MPLSPRPRELKLAIALTSVGLIFNLALTVVSRDLIGDVWILWLFFQGLFTAVLAVFLMFAYNGKGWVRYFMLVMYALCYYQLWKIDYRAFFEPIIILGFLISLATIALWFMPKSNRWYKYPRSRLPD